MSILYTSQRNQSHLAVIVGNELVGKAVVGLTIVELEDNSKNQRRLTVDNSYMTQSRSVEYTIENVSSGSTHRDKLL